MLAKALPPSFRHVKLLLARERGHPQGEPSEGYDLLVPLDESGRLDPSIWKANQAKCRVRRFAGDEDVGIGRLRRKPGGQWYSTMQKARTMTKSAFALAQNAL